MLPVDELRNEETLHFIWKNKLFDHDSLVTSCGKPINILDYGAYNKNAGPDFLFAKIQVDNLLWIGNVEIHKKSSHWKDHKHNVDRAYENVILHVVYQDNKPVRYSNNNELIPTLSLENRISQSTLSSINVSSSMEETIVCKSSLKKIDQETVQECLRGALKQRLDRRTIIIHRDLDALNNDWEEVFYRNLFRCFGMNANSEAFYRLACITPLRYIRKNQDNPDAIAALLYGQAGMLKGEFRDKYPQRLQVEYQYLQSKYGLDSMDLVEWKFSKMRPPNFPTIRIAQLLTLLQHTKGIFSRSIAAPMTDLKDLFTIEAGIYWNDKFRFDATAKRIHPKRIGDATMHGLIINLIVPFKYAYGQFVRNKKLQESAIEMLRQVPSEKNSVLSKWKSCGLNSDSAWNSQALIELYQNHCVFKKCLSCSIGIKALK